MVNEELVARLPGIHMVGCATGAPRGYAAIAWLLAELKSMVAASDGETWRAVFRYLGSQYAQLDRFEIVLGVLDALPDIAEVQQWGPAWLESLHAARIHPLSVILCSTKQAHISELALVAAYYKACFPGDRTNVQRVVQRGRQFDREEWRIILPADHVISNLLSSQTVILAERHPHTVTSIGHGWAVPGLVTGTVPGFTRLGDDLVVLGDAEFGSAPLLKNLGQGARIGGRLKIWKKGFVTGTSQKRFHPKGAYAAEAGLNWRGTGYVCVDNVLLETSSLRDQAITIPDSWMILITGAGRD